MRAFRPISFLTFSIVLSVSRLVAAAEIRDGSTFERAILVPGDYEHSGAWEWNYLRTHFRGLGMPKQAGLLQHNGRTYDEFVFGAARGDKFVYFDLTRFASRIYKKRTKSLDQIMKETGMK
jgi:hypothetical protein